ncbi:MAG: hypothetical protein LH610_04775 [Sphingomonas bacterium]|nr:hypothetical protein [Sphingomonas bacterium]
MERLADDFWNIRGDFRILHVINVGTQMSVARTPGGTFVLLDAFEPDKADQDELLTLTDGGSRIEAVLNLHPFHTVHCAFVQKWLPHARLIGTRRHHQHLPNLQWDPALIEDAATQQQFADAFDFSIPSGVDFISDDEDVHVGSVIARHRASGSVHSDDTLNVLDLPSLLQKVVRGPILRFHPKLAEGLEKRAGAAADYMCWARDVARDWADTQIICAAHNGILKLTNETFAEAIENALEFASDTLDQHREKYG